MEERIKRPRIQRVSAEPITLNKNFMAVNTTKPAVKKPESYYAIIWGRKFKIRESDILNFTKAGISIVKE